MTTVTLWAPRARSVAVEQDGRRRAMRLDTGGWWRGDLDERPSTSSVEGAAWVFARAFASAIGAPLSIET